MEAVEKTVKKKWSDPSAQSNFIPPKKIDYLMINYLIKIDNSVMDYKGFIVSWFLFKDSC